MRSLNLISIVILSGSLLAVGCGGTTVSTTGNDTGSGGGGGQGGNGGGTGGTSCEPTAELCDGEDNNCDGQVDEGCSCTVGATQPCYSGKDDTKDKGACHGGTQTCDAQGAWGNCDGEVVPTTESCNGLDDDCNGAADELGMLQCGVGVCKTVIAACENGASNTCVPGPPSTEICDGLDNDCDQLTDETFPGEGDDCDSGLLGQCQAGIKTCATEGGVTGETCVPTNAPAAETCNGLDDDCDGTVDDGVPGVGEACVTGLPGECKSGVTACEDGVFGCLPLTPPAAEICDSKDNDCDGLIDDVVGVGAACSTGMPGACAPGVKQCQGGALQCLQNVQPSTEVCGDSVDNDCNGQVDENCGIYTISGVATNVPISQLNGWTQCYKDTYDQFGPSLGAILTTCNKPKLMLGCRVTGASTLLVVAQAPRLDVIFDTGQSNTPHNANGVGWYYSGDYSWGFAPQGDPIQRESCDTVASSFNPGPNGDKRLCWHTGAQTLNGGWRCGTNEDLNGSTAYERLIYHAN